MTGTGVSRAVALVTGANRGLGRAFVDVLLAGGASRVYAGVREPERAAGLAALPGVTVVRVDLADRASIAAAAELADDLTLLVNNAAAAAFAPPLLAARDDIAREVLVNYLGTYDMVELCAPTLERHGGAVITVLSKLALTNAPGMAGYAASKAASHAMSDSLRVVLAARGVSLHAAYPGAIDTDMLSRFRGAKSAPTAVAEAILAGAARGETHIFPDPESRAYALGAGLLGA